MLILLKFFLFIKIFLFITLNNITYFFFSSYNYFLSNALKEISFSLDLHQSLYNIWITLL